MNEGACVKASSSWKRIQRVARSMRDERGQATVEYAVILGAFLAVVIALGTLWRAMDDGTFLEHALSAASHHLQLSAAGVIDVFLY